MSVEWAGPYFRAEDAEGRRLAWDPLGGRRPPRGAVRWIVRWRVTGFANPRKRTFIDAAEAAEWGRRIAAAEMLGAPCDARGWPVIDSAGAAAFARGAGPRSSQEPGSSTAGRDGFSTRRHEAPSATTSEPGADSSMGGPTVDRRGGPAGLGADVASYIDELIEVHQPYWEQSNQHRWWIDQLSFVKFAFRYPDDDGRIALHGVAPGDSIHLRLIGQADFNRALHLRRTTNNRVAHQNRQRQERYQREMADYEAKLATWNSRSGHRGRKPTPPKPPKTEIESSPSKVLIKANTENRFRTVLSFVFDRAFDGGLFPPGPNPYRQWNPRGSGGRHSSRRSPFRQPERSSADQRDYPGFGFWVDLGDVMATRGEMVASGVRTGERYRVLPVTAAQLAPRPGEAQRLRHEHFHADVGETVIEPEPGGHLKQREVGEPRTTPLSALVAALIDQHVAGGLAGPDGTLFLSPTGMELDLTNLYEDFLRPAIAVLCAEHGLWPEYPALAGATFYDIRKAAITTWVSYGADTLEAAGWSGHTEFELLRSYRGVLQGRGRRATWAGVDTMVEQALLADPPRGDGPLARHVRDWLER